ncbi:MAG: sulfotransferase [Gammaproteobacteria bacterium]|nr:sulfotransferase [Gammaproteobacteria bacterium]
MGSTIHLDDLAAPRFSEAVREMLQGVASIPVDLSEAAVLAAARAQTGLEDFGAGDFRERLGLIVQSMHEDTDLSALGKLTNFSMLVRFAANRLRLEDLIRRHPEILEIEIRRPIIVAGLARSGTTHLLNLLSNDTGLRSLPYWEALEPIPVPGETPDAHGEDPRLLRCRQGIEMQDQVMPLFKLMFNLQAERTHEEIELLAIDFSTMFIENLGLLPRWRDHYLAHDQTPHYEYLKKVLQALQWLRGPERWLLKTPQHLEQFGPLMKVFPDATVVITHRDPVATVASMTTLVSYAARMSREPVRPRDIGHYWADRIEQMLRACVRDRELLPAAQSIDVRFHEFNADDLGTVQRIYDLAGQPLTAALRSGMQQFIRENPRGKEGKIAYDLAVLGLDEAELRQRLRFYSERFATLDERIG